MSVAGKGNLVTAEKLFLLWRVSARPVRKRRIGNRRNRLSHQTPKRRLQILPGKNTKIHVG